MKNILCKVYAAFSPAGEEARKGVEEAAKGAVGGSEEWLFLEKDMLRISFEGAYFPLEETLAALQGLLPPDAEGKLDYLDLEEWKLLRHEFLNGRFSASERGLNHVLDYSGH